MKRLTALTTCCFAVLFVTSCKGNKDEVKATLIQKCEADRAANLPASLKGAIHDYCQCSTDKLLDKYSESEMRAMEKMTPAQQQAKAQPVMQECNDNFAKAMQKEAQPVPAP